MSYFGKEWDRAFKVMLFLSVAALAALVVGGIWLVIWLIDHVRFV